MGFLEFTGRDLVYSGKIHWVIYLPAMILALVALAALTKKGAYTYRRGGSFALQPPRST